MLERAVNPEGIRPGSAIVSDTGALCIDEVTKEVKELRNSCRNSGSTRHFVRHRQVTFESGGDSYSS